MQKFIVFVVFRGQIAILERALRVIKGVKGLSLQPPTCGGYRFRYPGRETAGTFECYVSLSIPRRAVGVRQDGNLRCCRCAPSE